MPSFCSAYGCSNAGYKLECINKISFHQFPLHDPNLLKMWLIQIRRKDFHPKKYSRLCSAHFEYDCFIRNDRNSRMLKPNSVPTKFSYNLEEKLHSQSINNLIGTLDTDAVSTNISSANNTGVLCNDESEDEINQLSNNAVEIQAGDVETILTEDPLYISDVLTEKSTNEKFHSPKQLKNDSSSQKLKEKEEEAKRISALKNRLMSTVVKRSLKRALLESEIKAANARRDFYDNKKSLLSLRSVGNNTKAVSRSLTEQKILEDLKEEESAFNIERSILQKQLIEAEKKAATSTKTYYEMKNSSLSAANRCS